MERRLAAILAADVVGYARLMGGDEIGTLDRLKNLRQNVIEPIIAAHRGRVVKLMGDGLLVEFASAANAIACALAWREAMTSENATKTEGEPLRFRIGAHIGDVIAEGDDIHGNGVNIAARLESMAPTDGVWISEEVWRHADAATQARFEDVGEQALKNIDRPIRVFQHPAETTRETVQQPKARSGKPTVAVLPFRNLSGDPEQEYFSDGISEDVITGLSR